MPIFMKHVTERSDATFAINADTKEKADELFDKFFNDDTKYDEYRSHMNETLQEHIVDGLSFSNEDAYNKASFVNAPDFWIGKPINKKDPVYDLYLIFDEGVGKVRKVWTGIKLGTVSSIILEYDKDYILRPFAGVNINCYKEADKRNAIVVAYRLERRAD